MHDLTKDAALLRGLHVPGQPLILANVWDAATASVVERAGAKAVATSSVAVAHAHGLPDHDVMPPGVVFGSLEEIANAVTLPVTADLEAGYRLDPADLVDRLLKAGAVGCNIEDTDHHAGGGMIPLREQAARLAGIRAAAKSAGVPIVINARIDLFLPSRQQTDATLGEAIERGRAYLEAGADCVYPIFLGDPAAIAEMAKELGGRLNVLARPAVPAPRELAALGVCRVSVGGGFQRVAMDAFRAAAADLLA